MTRYIFLCLFTILVCISSCKRFSSQEEEKRGRLQTFYTNGFLKTDLGIDSLGRNDGKCYWYYPNGNKEIVANYMHGQIIETATYFYQNGSVKSYGFYDLKGNLRYRIDFDSLGHGVINEEGKSLYAIIHNKEGVFFQDTLNIEVRFLLVEESPSNLSFILNDQVTNVVATKEKNKPLFQYVIDESIASELEIKIVNHIALKKVDYVIGDTLNLRIPVNISR